MLFARFSVNIHKHIIGVTFAQPKIVFDGYSTDNVR